MLTLAPTVHLAVVAQEEGRVAATSDLLNVPHRDVFYQHWRVFESHGIIDTKLAVFIGAHRVDVVIKGDEAGVAEAASHLPDRDVVAAELGERVPLISS